MKSLFLLLTLVLLALMPAAAQDEPPLPDKLEPITAANIARLQPVGTLGRGNLYAIGLLADANGRQVLAAIATFGIGLHDPETLSLLDFIPYQTNPFTDDTPGPNTRGGTSSLTAQFEGSVVSFAADDQLWSIDIASGVQTAVELPKDYVPPESPTVSPDGRWEMTMERDPQTLRKIFTMKNTVTDEQRELEFVGCGGFGMGPGLVFGDNKILYGASGPYSGVILRWSLMDGALLNAVGGYGPEDIYSTEFSTEGRYLLVMTGGGRTSRLCPNQRTPGDGIYRYDLQTGEVTHHAPEGMDFPYLTARSSDDRTMAYIDGYGMMSVWRDDQPLATFPILVDGETRAAWAVAVSADGAYVAAMGTDWLLAWDTAKLQPDEPVFRLLASDDAALLPPDQTQMPPYFMRPLSFAGTTLVLVTVDRIRLIDLPSGKEQFTLEPGQIFMSDFRPETGLLAMEVTKDYATSIQLWRLEDGVFTQIGAIKTYSGNLVRLSPDGRLLLTSDMSDGLTFYDTETLQPVFVIEEIFPTTLPTFSPDGTLIAMGQILPGRYVQLWGVPGR